ncbi:uroporphyrinogen-III C-methyltransferase [gamma proteobacterium HIMB55]|nr:uroporphyrinogen-III C-methyltransferase [gamma proteobacterium HIMB55]
MDFLPIFVATKDRKIVVVGHGQMADAKCRGVLKTAANVMVFADTPSVEAQGWAAQGLIDLRSGLPSAQDFEEATLFYAAHADDSINDALADMARSAGAIVNVLDRTDACDFITPAIVDRDPVVVAIGTEGSAPVLARQIKADVEAMLPAELGRFARLANAFRSKVRALPEGLPRRNFWKAFFKPERIQAAGSDEVIKASLEALLSQHLEAEPEAGSVAFVGAGPGDPELLTLKARRHIHEAEVIIYDRLVGKGVLELARREAKFIDVGKKGFGAQVTQDKINEYLVREALAGWKVVRLKGGDPSVFGRLDEELAALAEAGIDSTVVPGITSAAAGAASLKQSLTRRDRNSSITFMTAHDAKGYAEHDWRQLVRSGQALAIYMGRKSATFLQGRLLMAGADTDLVITCVENISRPEERRFTSTLSEFAQRLDDDNWNGPLIIFVGIGNERVANTVKTPALQEVSHGTY